MKLRLWTCVSLPAAVLAAVAPARGQAQTCIGMGEYDSLAVGVISMVRQYTSPADSAFEHSRVALGYPLVAPNQVTLVTKEQDCKKARDAFNANNTTGGGWTNRVIAVKAGSTYTVIDPGYYYNPSGRRLLYTLLNQQFNFIRRIGG